MSPRLTSRSLLTSGLALTLGAVVQAVFGFLAQLVLMRLLIPEDFGRFAVVLAGCSLVQTVLSLRLTVLIIRLPEAEMTPERIARYQAALVWETVASVLVTLAWLLAAGLADAYALTLVAALALAQWTNQMAAFYERRMAYGPITLVETGSQVLGHGIAVALVLAGGGAAALYVREVAVALLRLGAFARLGALAPPCWRLPRLAELRLLLGEARAYWIEGVSDSGFTRLVVLCAGGVAGMHGTGLLAQSQRLALIPHQLMAPVVGRLSANAFSRSDDGQRRRLLVPLVSVSLALLGIAAALAVAFADPVVPWLFGAHWAPAAGILVALAGMIIFFPTFELLRGYCFAVGRVRLVLLARVAQFGVFLAGVWLASGAADPVGVLAWSLSAAYGAAFAVVGAGQLLGRRRAATQSGAATRVTTSPPP